MVSPRCSLNSGRLRSRLAILAMAAAGLAISAQLSLAAELVFDTKTLFEKSQLNDLQVAKDNKGVDRGIELFWGQLYEDDGPGAGFSYKPNVEQLGKDILIKKTLVIPRPQAKKGYLLLATRTLFGVKINGTPIELPIPGMQDAGTDWIRVPFSAKVLQSGENEIVLEGAGKIRIARDDEYAIGATDGRTPPNRSAKSIDGGKTWDDKHLGIDNDIDGEYNIRVFLDQYRVTGTLTSPVVDAGNLEGTAIAPPVTDVGPIRVSVDGASVSKGSGKIVLRARTSPSLSPSAENWSPWQDLNSPKGVIAKPTGRYVQVSVELSGDDPLKSPRFRGIRIEAKPKRTDDWTTHVRVQENQNPEIVRTSVPFAYETFNHPKLERLRKDYHLDDVVAGAKDELELITRLADWSSRQWQKNHLMEIYPAWDALDIMSTYKDGKPIGGFCQQYNLVFMQACESFGLVGRPVSLGPGSLGGTKLAGGHEVVEIWSNQFQKWMYIDGHVTHYFVDKETGVPLSLWELRDRQLSMVFGQPTREVDRVKINDVRAWPKGGEWEGLGSKSNVPFGELRMVPRSNFLSQTHPLPLNQGMLAWFWTGHYVWTDNRLPAFMLYNHRLTRPGDFVWTLNQAHLALEALDKPGQLRVQIDTETPGLDTLLAKIDDQETQPVTSGFAWDLKPGRNRLEVWPKNTAGRDGIKSQIVLDYQPKGK